MIYLLDTDMLIYMIRGFRAAKKALRERADEVFDRCHGAQLAGNDVGLSAITVSELEFGARNSGRYETEIVAINELLTPFQVFDFDSVACPQEYGRLRYELRRSGIPIGDMDLLIAAHALALKATLVTNNLAHFSRVRGLTTVNWLTS